MIEDLFFLGGGGNVGENRAMFLIWMMEKFIRNTSNGK